MDETSGSGNPKSLLRKVRLTEVTTGPRSRVSVWPALDIALSLLSEERQGFQLTSCSPEAGSAMGSGGWQAEWGLPVCLRFIATRKGWKELEVRQVMS